jgi:glycosyltransferase involved in cell wall biosynthesis
VAIHIGKNSPMSETILIVRSNPISPDPRVERVARALEGGGYQVTILGWDRTKELPIREERSYGTLQRLSIPADFGRGIRNLPYLLKFELGLTRWLIQNRSEYDIIHACDFDTVLPALLIRCLWKKKVVYDIFDFYAEMLRATPLLFKQIIRLVDIWAIDRVDALILADDSRKAQIKGSKPKKLFVIYNTPEDLIPKNQELDFEQPDESKLRIAFVGLLHVERGLMELLNVHSRHREWSLDLAGFGGDEEIIIGKAQQLKNVSLHGRVSYEKAMELHLQADVLIATYDPSIPNHRFSSPNKLFEAMMLGKPIIVAAGTNMDRIVEETGCGIVIPYGDISALEQALQRLASNPQFRAQLGAAGRKAYETRYNWGLMRRRLLNLYADL